MRTPSELPTSNPQAPSDNASARRFRNATQATPPTNSTPTTSASTSAVPGSNRAMLTSLWRLGWPVLFQSLLAASLGLVDTLMVSSVGPAALAGVGLVSRVLFVLTMVLAGLASGTGAMVAQYVGAGRWRATRGPVTLAVFSGLLLTLPMLLISLTSAATFAGLLTPDRAVSDAATIFLRWGALIAPLCAVTLPLSAALRGRGDTRTPMWAGLAALALNTLLNVLFINGALGLPALGVAAAAASTSAARLLEAAWLLHALAPGPLRRLSRSIRRRDWMHLLQVAAPLMLKEIAWAGGILASTLIVSRMGRLALATFNLVLPFEGVLISVVAAAGVATGIQLGQALGRGDLADAYRSAEQSRRLVSRTASAVGIGFAVLLQLLQLLHLTAWLDHWIATPMRSLALDTLTVLSLAFGARAHNTIVSVGILRSGADARWLFWADLCSMWLINVPMVAFAALYLRWPLPAVVGVMLLEEILKVPVFRWRVRSGRWLHRIGVPVATPRISIARLS